MKVNNIAQLVGSTPILRINYLSQAAQVWAKCEFLNPSHSVKDRIAKGMIEKALKDGKIDKKSTIIEPTSGNTGIGLAMICASLNIKLILTMPESMSLERRKLLKFLGANLVLTDASLGMNGAIQKAKELAKTTPNSFILSQFTNPANPKTHEDTTAVEIFKQMEGKIDFLVCGVGTGGSLTGIGTYLKQKLPNIKIVAVEPEDSAVLSGESAGKHGIQGIGAGFIPEVLDTSLYDKTIKVSTQNAINEAINLAKNEGVLAGISSGANLFASSQIAMKNPDKNIITILCDTAERYLSTDLF